MNLSAERHANPKHYSLVALHRCLANTYGDRSCYNKDFGSRQYPQAGRATGTVISVPPMAPRIIPRFRMVLKKWLFDNCCKEQREGGIYSAICAGKSAE